MKKEMNSLKCPLCGSTDIAVARFNPDDHGLCYHTYYKCRNCGRETEAEEWETLTGTDLLIIDNRFLTAEVEHLKAEVKRLKAEVERLKAGRNTDKERTKTEQSE